MDSLTVKIAPGGAVLGGYTYVNSSIGVRAISSAAATKARRDLCVLKLDLSIRAMTVVIKSGMPSDDPQPPALTSTDSVKELALAEIYMPAGASSVNEATVTDLRVLASLRGASALIEAGIKAHEAETDALTKSENTEVRKVCGAVKTDGISGEVLCGDGKYRTVLPYRRTLLQIYNRAGEYEFDTSKNPSDANRYDFEMIGGGGAGGCCGHSDSRGVHVGAGAYVSVCGVTLSHGTHKIKIGAGGSASPKEAEATAAKARLRDITLREAPAVSAAHGQKVCRFPAGKAVLSARISESAAATEGIPFRPTKSRPAESARRLRSARVVPESRVLHPPERRG